MESVVSDRLTVCVSCGSEVAAWEAFCEGCGATLSPTEERPAEALADEVPISRVLHAPGEETAATPAAARPCLECGGTVDADGYCQQCGAKAPSERDHYAETPASWVGGVCDRGVRHHRNEDAMALSAEPVPGSHAVLVVCDGVSSSDDSHLASLAAARAARGVLVSQHPVGMAVPESQIQALTTTFADAVQAANEAVIGATVAGSANPPSCTFAAAEIDNDLIVFGNIGDSRVYWLADTGLSQQLSVDDSMAQLNMAAGMSRGEAESGPGSHAITRWLGTDAPDLVPTTGHLMRPGNGWLLVCSDGLWNYASAPEDLESVFARILLEKPEATDPTLLAGELVRWANAQGGRDNITVALARFGPHDEFPGRVRPVQESPIEPEESTPTVHTGPVRSGSEPAGPPPGSGAPADSGAQPDQGAPMPPAPHDPGPPTTGPVAAPATDQPATDQY